MNININTDTKEIVIMSPVSLKELKRFLKILVDGDEYTIVSHYERTWDYHKFPITTPTITPYEVTCSPSTCSSTGWSVYVGKCSGWIDD